jgi:hemerythrin-like domain-containing protein
MSHDRRTLLSALPALAVSAAARPRRRAEAEEEISAPEDLMREHGVLNRILLIYEEGLRRLKGGQDVGPESFSRPAELVRKFVEDYHEKLEERFVFPRFERHATLASLVGTLRDQHQAGRRLTEAVLAGAASLGKPDSRQAVIRACEAFIRMYRPHEAREDTVLFPALYKVAGAAAVKELGERFEAEEHRLFGEDGFAKTVEDVAAIEKQLGIYDLAAYTPA